MERTFVVRLPLPLPRSPPSSSSPNDLSLPASSDASAVDQIKVKLPDRSLVRERSPPLDQQRAASTDRGAGEGVAAEVKKLNPVKPRQARAPLPKKHTAPVPRAARPQTVPPSLRAQGLLGPPGYYSDVYYRHFANTPRYDRGSRRRRQPLQPDPRPSASEPDSVLQPLHSPAHLSGAGVTTRSAPGPAVISPNPSTPPPLPTTPPSTPGLENIQVFVRNGDRTFTVTLPCPATGAELLSAVTRRLAPTESTEPAAGFTGFTLLAAGKPVRCNLPLSDYGIRNGSQVELLVRHELLLGGVPRKRHYDRVDYDDSDANGLYIGDDGEANGLDPEEEEEDGLEDLDYDDAYYEALEDDEDALECSARRYLVKRPRLPRFHRPTINEAYDELAANEACLEEADDEVLRLRKRVQELERWHTRDTECIAHLTAENVELKARQEELDERDRQLKRESAKLTKAKARLKASIASIAPVQANVEGQGNVSDPLVTAAEEELEEAEDQKMDTENNLDAMNAENDRERSADDTHPTEALAAARRELTLTAPTSASTTTSPPAPNGSTVVAAAASPTSPAPLENVSLSATLAATDSATSTTEQERDNGRWLPEEDAEMAEVPQPPAVLLVEDLHASSADDPTARLSASAKDHPDDDCELAEDRPAHDESPPTSEVDEAGEPVDEETEGDPMAAELRRVWFDRPIRKALNIEKPPVEPSRLYIINLDAPSPDAQLKDLPDTLFLLDPVIAGSPHVLAASRLSRQPISLSRQFPHYRGTVLFEKILFVFRNCDRVVWDLFSVADGYLPHLLTCDVLLEWARSLCLRVSHSSYHRAYRIARQVNDQLALALLDSGLERGEAFRPRVTVQQVRTTDVPSYHSKQLTAASTDGSAIMILDGSGNASQRGLGGFASADDGSALSGSSHETAPLIVLPAASLAAQQHLRECDLFVGFLGQAGRLLPSDATAAAPIGLVSTVKAADEAVKTAKKTARLAKLEAQAREARKSAWEDVFKKVEPLSLSNIVGPVPSPISSSQDPGCKIQLFGTRLQGAKQGKEHQSPTSSTTKSLYRLPEPHDEPEAQQRQNKNPRNAKWHAKDQKPGVGMRPGTVICCDCGLCIEGLLPPHREASYKVPHFPGGRGCESYVTPNRSALVWHEDDDSHSVRIQQHFEALKGHSIQDPISGVRLYNLVISWYSTLQDDLEDYAAIRTSLEQFAATVNAHHPYLPTIRRALADPKQTTLSAILRPIVGSVMTKLRLPKDKLTGQQKSQRGIRSGLLAEVLRKTYTLVKKKTGDEADDEDEEDDGDTDDGTDDDDDDDGEFS